MHTYLDWNSYGIIHPNILESMQNAWKNYTNPLSKHALGQSSKQYLLTLESQLKLSLDAKNYNIIFTSGATEANVHILKSFDNVYISDIEHPSIHNCPHATIIPVDELASMNYEILEDHIKTLNQPFLVSYMLANHETGIINNLKKVRELCNKYGGFLHTDAVQAFGRIDISVSDLDVDYMTICAHKFGGPGGVGALLYKNSAPMRRFSWGKQIRAGTYIIPLIDGMVKSLEISPSSNSFFEDRLNPDLIIGYNLPRLSNTTCMKCKNKTILLMALGMNEIYVSSGAACTSGESDRALSVQSMGIDSDTIRISSGWNTKEDDFIKLLNIVNEY